MRPAKANKGDYQNPDLRLGIVGTTGLRTKGGCENIEEDVTNILLAAVENKDRPTMQMHEFSTCSVAHESFFQ
ncbi:hypothetical protein T12_1446 [Trichinella patagoniensis]|uniref:Uncharacterized protein n=1 Tax=Trichinella patagoniensis TaxID=990121 RepID=A0A0V0ZMX0_9BILA|nr:hypothetical protein T12_1446 [Trichinella patagoniensis]